MKLHLGIAGIFLVAFAASVALAVGSMPSNWMPLKDNFSGYCMVGIGCDPSSRDYGDCDRIADVYYNERDGIRGLSSRYEITRIVYWDNMR